MDLVLSGAGSLAEQVYAALRARLEAGTLRAGDRLPASRTLADVLGVSRGVVVGAYERLVAEGYLAARIGDGTRVLFDGSTTRRPAERVRPRGVERLPAVELPIRWDRPSPAALDLRSGLPNTDDFPHAEWARLARRCLGAERRPAFDYPAPGGLPELRSAIAGYLRRQRGFACEPAAVIITGGAQAAFGLALGALLPPASRVAMEDPGYGGFAVAVRAAGHRLVPVALDGEGLCVDLLDRSGAQAVHVTPAHQFPVGTVMSAGRRRALLDWAAERRGRLVVEDDYDSEYRFDGPALEPLKALDADGRVLLVGSFSKTVLPGLRLGFIVADEDRAAELIARAVTLDAGLPTFWQRVVALFIEEGHFERHLRRSRRRNGERRGVVVDAVRARFGRNVRLVGDSAGLHVTLDLGLDRTAEEAVVRLLRERGVRLHVVSDFARSGRWQPGFMLGYSRLDAARLRTAVDLLGAAVDQVNGV
ncbi:MAG: PLP-dependent aminotransferase family protein [Pseudomonadales bacterium]|nr:PLP-dependent aminotransferase family protein [Pseudomonadales bacterium]